MKNTFGNALNVTLFGESHGAAIGATLDGLPAGIGIDENEIRRQLDRRRAQGATSTARKEPDIAHIISGVFQSKTTGAPLTVIIENTNTHSNDYEDTRFLARPSHADYAAHQKYKGFEDFRGGGHFSARLTAPLVALGSIVASALAKKQIFIATHMLRCGGLGDRPFDDLRSDSLYLRSLPTDAFPTLDSVAAAHMEARILEAKAQGDSVGGVLETAVIGLPVGLGEPWFDSVESLLSHGLFSIPAVKGVEFGSGFAIAELCGSTANDAFFYENGTVSTATNHNGGINGGITNGMPLLFRTAFKPTPSIAREQHTIDMKNQTDATLSIHGRHDPCVVRRAAAVVDSMTALVLGDLLIQSSGRDALL